MKLTLKYPVRPKLNAEEQIFHSSKTTQQVENTQNATIFGCIAFVVYFLVFLSVYGTSRYSGNLSLVPKLIKSGGDVQGFTMSEAFEHCHKESSTILIIIFFGLLQALYSEQNFSDDPKRIAVVAMNYIILIGWLSLYFVLRDQQSHLLIAILVVICTLVNTIIVTELYTENYQASELDMITDPCYIIIAIYAMLFIVFVISGLHYGNYGINNTTRFITGAVGVFEILGIIMFGIFIVIFSQLPPLPNNGNLVCSYTS